MRILIDRHNVLISSKLIVWSLLQALCRVCVCVGRFVSACPCKHLRAGAMSASQVAEILAQVRDGAVGLVKAAASLDSIFQAMGLAYNQQINPRQVGLDPCNRDSHGVNNEDVHALTHDITFVGWSWDETHKATCVEEVPGQNVVETYNAKLCESSRSLAPVEKGSIRFGSLACGHTNMALRSIAAAMPSDDPFSPRDGHLSLDTLRERDPACADAVQDGLRWRVYTYTVREELPEALNGIQQAMNFGGQVQRQEHEVQVLTRMQGLASRMQQKDGNVDWETVRRGVLRTMPPFADAVDDYIFLGKSWWRRGWGAYA